MPAGRYVTCRSSSPSDPPMNIPEPLGSLVADEPAAPHVPAIDDPLWGRRPDEAGTVRGRTAVGGVLVGVGLVGAFGALVMDVTGYGDAANAERLVRQVIFTILSCTAFLGGLMCLFAPDRR